MRLKSANISVKRRIKPSSARAKGKNFEKEVCEDIADWIGLTTADVVRTRSGTGECDALLSEQARTLWGYWAECKNHRSLSIPQWLRQAKLACGKLGKNQEPIIVFKQHGDGTKYVVVRWDVFMDLSTRHLNELRKGTQK